MKVSKVDEQVFGQRHFCLQHKEGMKEISDGWHVTFEKFIYLRLVSIYLQTIRMFEILCSVFAFY